MIEEIKINTMEEFLKKINSLSNNFVYRGHADSTWPLQSTLERLIGKKWDTNTARTFENRSLDVFKSKYHIYNGNEHVPQSKLAWLSVMQHYGVPTRLIDFTESPYIALYFALESYIPQLKNDLAIFAIDYTAVMDASILNLRNKVHDFSQTRLTIQGEQDKIFDEIVDKYSCDIAWITEPLELNARIDRQAGTFLISGNLEKTIESLINLQQYENCKIYKYIISSSLYEGIYVALRKMNINAKSIYGDLSGLARSIKMELQGYTV